MTSNTRRTSLPLAGMLTVLLAASATPAAAATSSGAALYSKHCRGCHSEQVHERGNKRVSDWDSLIAQVRHCQRNAGREWGDAEVEAVARYLNDRYYHLPGASSNLRQHVRGGGVALR